MSASDQSLQDMMKLLKQARTVNNSSVAKPQLVEHNLEKNKPPEKNFVPKPLLPPPKVPMKKSERAPLSETNGLHAHCCRTLIPDKNGVKIGQPCELCAEKLKEMLKKKKSVSNVFNNS